MSFAEFYISLLRKTTVLEPSRECMDLLAIDCNKLLTLLKREEEYLEQALLAVFCKPEFENKLIDCVSAIVKVNFKGKFTMSFGKKGKYSFLLNINIPEVPFVILNLPQEKRNGEILLFSVLCLYFDDFEEGKKILEELTSNCFPRSNSFEEDNNCFRVSEVVYCRKTPPLSVKKSCKVQIVDECNALTITDLESTKVKGTVIPMVCDTLYNFLNTDKVCISNTPRAVHFMRPDFPLRVYDPSCAKVKKNQDVNTGQRKLFNLLLLFLTTSIVKGKKYTLVYPTSTHLYYLTQIVNLFTDVEFHIFGGSEVQTKNKRVKVFKSLTETDIKKYSKQKRILLFYDLKDVSLTKQINIARSIRPKASMLKVNFPWENGSTKFFDGYPILQPFTSEFSTEIRLITSDYNSEKLWNNKQHEQVMYYHNTVTRKLNYKVDDRVLDYDRAWEACAALMYLNSFDSDKTLNEFLKSRWKKG